MLPEILESLRKIKEDNNFDATAETTFSETVTNQLSSSVKVKISQDSRELHLFIKFLDPAHYRSGFYEDSHLYFHNEIVFYREIAAKFATFAEGAVHKVTCLAKCYAIGGDQEGNQPLFIVLEDLGVAGYAPLDAKQSLTAESARAVLRQLGQFHAYSIALRVRHPQELATATGQLEETVFRDDKKKIFTNAIHDAYRLAKKSFPADSVYVDRFGGFLLGMFERMGDLVKGGNEDGDCRVVTHGDLWLNNVLCKRDTESGGICDVAVFVDFQGCRYSSPVHDLMSLLLTGMDKNELDQHGHDLVQSYRASLCRTLRDLGADPVELFPRPQLQRQLLRHTQLALALALAGLPVLLHDGGGPAAAGGTGGGLEGFLQRLRDSMTLRCKNKMLELIVYAVDQGYIQ